MFIRLMNEDGEEVANFETETDLEGTIMIVNEITEYCIDSNIYARTDNKIMFDKDVNALQINVE